MGFGEAAKLVHEEKFKSFYNPLGQKMDKWTGMIPKGHHSCFGDFPADYPIPAPGANSGARQKIGPMAKLKISGMAALTPRSGPATDRSVAESMKSPVKSPRTAKNTGSGGASFSTTKKPP